MSKDENSALKLQLVSQPQEYFHELLSGAFNKRSLKPTAETSFYLVNLLNQFMTTDALYARDAEGRHREEALALLVKEAHELSASEEKRVIYRQVGDLSLYRAGFFQESLNRKLVDIDYYIEMGGHAYREAASRHDEKALRIVFEELAHRFGRFVDVLADVSDQTMAKTERNLLRLYENWVQTKSERAERLLNEAGIIPNATIKKNVQ
ncbi:MAG: hypothetical protein JST04_16900 [Bdellovibrionales bacterium]|nr:hypothetical protein [Bdellovibrionales bacterium]